MPETVETTRTVNRATSTIPVEDLKANIRSVASELMKVRDQVRAEAESLERMRTMLDVGALNDLMGVVETLEERITTVERAANQEASQAREAQEALAAEQERLAKLWDAYKVQEDELKKRNREETYLKERVGERDRIIDELEREVGNLEQFVPFKERHDTIVVETDRLRKRNRELSEHVENLESQLAQHSTKMVELKAHEDQRGRVQELERNLSEEKERLAKLYKIYEDTEAKLKESSAEIEEWRGWFRRHKDAFEDVGVAARQKAGGA